MVMGPDTARNAVPEEFDEIDALLEAAFDSRAEADLVRRLRQDGSMAWEMVTPWYDRHQRERPIGAYAAISRMVEPKNWFCLGPVAVWPKWQNGALALTEDTVRADTLQQYFRFGSLLVGMVTMGFDDEALIRRALGGAGLLDGPETPTLVVLGKPSFYARAGFSLERAVRLISPYPISHTLIARAGDDVPERVLVYPPAFADL